MTEQEANAEERGDVSKPSGETKPTARRFSRMGQEGVAFVAELYAAQPRAPVTQAIVVLNALIFVIMVATGVDFMSPTAQQVLPWGANFGPSTSSGEWWRLLTSTYLHFGLMHVAFNMYILADMGRVVERLFGSAAFLVIYTIAGVLGSVGTLVWSPYVVSAGASGAVFGVFGAFFAYLLRERDTIPSDVTRHLGRDAAILVGINVLYGLGKSGIDNAAHIGGLAGGFVIALAFARPISAKLNVRKSLLLGACALGVIALAMVPLRGRAVDVERAFKTFEANEAAAVEIAQKAAAQFESGGHRDLYAKVIVDDIVPRWREMAADLEALTKLPASQQKLVEGFRNYVRQRLRANEMRVDALRAGDESKLAEADAMERGAFASLSGVGGKELDLVVEWQTTVATVAKIEADLLTYLREDFDAEVDAIEGGKVDDPAPTDAFKTSFETKVLVPWRNAVALVDDKKWDSLAADQLSVCQGLRRYAKTRLEAYELMEEAVLERDEAKSKRAEALIKAAEAP